MRLQKNDRLVMIGDSITDCGRTQPVGEGLADAIGKGYVALVDAFLRSDYPEYRIRVTNMGNSGNTVRDLKKRWDTDLLALKPDWVSIMIGINDVWRQFNTPLLTEQHVTLDEYARTLDTLIGAVRPGLQGLVLMTPYFIEPNRADPMRALMDRYGAVVRQLAGRHGALLVDTQAAFDQAMTHTHPMAMAPDRIHPNLVGHLVLARAFVNALDCGW